MKNLMAILCYAALMAGLQCSVAIAQLPACGMVYGINSAKIYNYDPLVPISAVNPSLNTISAPVGSSGLTVSPILGSSSSILTFYTTVAGNYFYYNPVTSGWVNTGHSAGVGAAVNIAEGGGYIYSQVGATSNVYKYSGAGNATFLVNVPNFGVARPWDLVVDCDANWYILNQTVPTLFLRKYSPSGTLLQSWSVTNPNSLSVQSAAGFGIIGNTLFTDNVTNHGIAFYTLGVSTLRLDSTKPFPANYNLDDIGTCAASVPSIPMVTIAASGNNGCVGATITFTATPVSGGTAPVYQWKVNGSNVGAGGATYSYVPSNGDVVTCVMTSNSICTISPTATSNALTMTVVTTPVTPAISIAASANGLCGGTPVVFTASPGNGGAAPTYQWKVNGVNVGASSTTYSYAPANGDIVTCVLTSSVSCVTASTATSNAVTMVVVAPIAPTINIGTPSATACMGSTVTIAATPGSGGTAPIFQWQVNGSNVGTNTPNYSYVPANGDVVTCVLTSNASCLTTPSATSNALVMTVINPVTPVISIAASANGVCTGTAVTFTASPGNGGTAPAYQWRVNNAVVSVTGATYNYTPLNGDTVMCVLASNATCVSPATSVSNILVMSVGPLVIPGINANTMPPIVGCEGTPILFFTNIVAGGPHPAYQWYRNGVALPGATAPTYTDSTLKNGDTIRVTLISSAPCPSTPITWSNYVGLTLSLPVVPTISINPAGPVPAGVSVTFTAAATGTGIHPVYQWKKNGVNIPFANGLSYTTSGLRGGDVISVTMVSGDPCAAPILVASNNVQASTGSTGIQVANNEWFTLLYPNPNKGSFIVSVSDRNMTGSKWFAIDVINNLGQAIYHYEGASQSRGLNQTVTLQENLPAGTYFLRVHADNGVAATIPFLILR